MVRKIYKHLIVIMYLNAKYAVVFNVLQQQSINNIT